MPEKFTIRTMSAEEVGSVAVAWAGAEGWNPCECDAACYYAADNGGFFVGELDGEPIAAISAVRYEGFGFLGFYIVAPSFRGQGYGIQLWRRAMEYLEGCVTGLDGVVAQQENYRRSGFALAYNNIRYQGSVNNLGSYSHPEVVDLGSVPFDTLLQYEADFFPASREAFLRCWVTQPGSVALGYIGDGELRGYIVARKCTDGYKIAPLFADTPEIAEALLRSALSKLPEGASWFIDIPEPNREAQKFTELFSLTESFRTARMYRGEAPNLPVERIYSVTSFEIG